MALLETLSFILEKFPWSFGNRNHLNVVCYLFFLFFQFDADTRRYSWESWDWEMWKGSQFLQILRNKYKAPEKSEFGGSRAILFSNEELQHGSRGCCASFMRPLLGGHFYVLLLWTLIRKMQMDKSRLYLPIFPKLRQKDKKYDWKFFISFWVKDAFKRQLCGASPVAQQ